MFQVSFFKHNTHFCLNRKPPTSQKADNDNNPPKKMKKTTRKGKTHDERRKTEADQEFG